MENGKKEVSKFKVESIENQTYRNLFEEITKCGVRDWTKLDGKYVLDLNHPSYQSYFRLDFIHLFDFLIKWISEGKHRSVVSEAKAKERKQDFRNELNKRAAGLAEVFRLGKNRNIQSSRVKIGVQTAAEFLDIELIHLLAEFLKDCESKKIRLLLHSEYEKDIENFLLDTPRLVAQLQSKSLRPITLDKQEQQLPEQTGADSRFRIEHVQGKEKWLDPYNHKELPLVGRKNEIALLDKFVEAEGQFKIWAIAGPSGSGKTRLASQWAYGLSALKDWDCRVLHKEDRTEPEQWDNWLPDNPTLIVIDYMYGFEDAILKLMKCSKKAKSKVRLLLIDHVFSEPLHSDKRWGFSGDGSSLNRNEKYFFDTKPLDLRETEDQEIIIKSIIAHRAGINIKSDEVNEAHDSLQNMQGAYHPLFAALVGDAIKSGKDFTVWNRRELIDYYLSGDNRLPWELENDSGRWASHFTAVAIARRGMTYRDLIEAAGNCISAPECFYDVKAICQNIVADNDAITLAPFEPDILGESFFLKFLQFLEKSPKYQEEFRQIFMAGNEGTQIEDTTEFIAFIQRLTRNLLNDDQSLKETRALWDSLFGFMNPADFRSTQPIHWAITVGLIDMIDVIQDQFPEKKIVTLLNKIDSTAFSQANNEDFFSSSVRHSMLYFELMHKFTEIPPELSEDMRALFDRYTESNLNRKTPLMIASVYGFNKMINALTEYRETEEAVLERGQNTKIDKISNCYIKTVKFPRKAENINATDINGCTALMWASEENQIDTVKLLLDKGAEVDITDQAESTALLKASFFNNHSHIVKLLLENDANIDATDEGGCTALIQACLANHTETVKLLLDNDAQVNAISVDGYTALIGACIHGNTEIINLLLDKGAKVEIPTEGFTALMHASIRGYSEIVKLLLDKDATNIDIYDDREGCTALIYASANNHVETVKLLLHKRAAINIPDNEDNTALIYASCNGHIETVRLLINEGADIDAINKNGETALSIAQANGHAEIIRLLIEHGMEY
ncbi:ankyrin repeat domain-containing protein [Nitrosomonas sp. Is24]|uniref:ankyrin repeat domain-containing protein n=1 Tax=Nitrosomonas sp. Is24 TaxID=3080533 RepID=UPI00294B1D37|nr:ankyrin repeat domain-containing protein [Nitrosomonas sp. Is24]MDV6341099.1 ankyrin repeat domain-containing protein [Nitrosomonas sp. Is24]